MTNTELAAKLKEVATRYKTRYVTGCFGAPMTELNKKRYGQTGVAVGADTFGFDCVCLIKGILWGWRGDARARYGGATYRSNGVPDIGTDAMIAQCAGVSADFSHLEVGEAVWLPGHIGVYIGDGLAVECTPKWENRVQITACNCTRAGYHRRNWKKHGRLPYVTYERREPAEPGVYRVGDTVTFTGSVHYTSSYATAIGRRCRAGSVKITAVKPGARHPYQARAVAGGGSTVCGWVNAADLAGDGQAYTPRVGDRVRLSAGAPVYGRTARFADWVYGCTLIVRSVQGDRVVISTQKTGAVTGAVDARYLTRV